MSKKKHTFVLTDESVNSYGYRVLAGGLDKTLFRKNPVMLYSHEYGLLPIGVWENVREEDGRLMADAKFDDGDAFAAEISRKVDAGVIRCCSIGFNVLEVDDSDSLRLPGQTGPTVTKAELMECSICTFGANRNAMRLSATDGNGVTAVVRPGCQMTLTMMQDEENKDKTLNITDMNEQERQQMEQLQTQLSQQAETIKTLSQERDDARSALKKVREAEVDALLAGAVSDGRIGEADKPSWKEMLSLTPESAKAALAKLTPRTSLAQMLYRNKGKGDFAGKSWQELDRAGKLSAFKEADIEGFKTLYRETFHAEYQE